MGFHSREFLFLLQLGEFLSQLGCFSVASSLEPELCITRTDPESEIFCGEKVKRKSEKLALFLVFVPSGRDQDL